MDDVIKTILEGKPSTELHIADSKRAIERMGEGFVFAGMKIADTFDALEKHSTPEESVLALIQAASLLLMAKHRRGGLADLNAMILAYDQLMSITSQVASQMSMHIQKDELRQTMVKDYNAVIEKSAHKITSHLPSNIPAKRQLDTAEEVSRNAASALMAAGSGIFTVAEQLVRQRDKETG